MSNVMVERLRAILGPEGASGDPADLEPYLWDRTEAPRGRADAVARPRTVEEVSAVLKLANELGAPVIPVVAGTNIGGLAIPERGGIVLDLRTMDRVIEVNERDLYMVIEPGVSFGKVHDYLAEHHPRLRIGYPMSPPESSVLANCILDGLGTLSLPNGSLAEWVNGLEVVLPTGELVRTGIGAMSETWCARGPLPDLTGLFIAFQGTTGVVTKLSMRLFPKPLHRRRAFVPASGVEPCMEAARRIARDGTCDDLGVLSWPIARLALGEKRVLSRDAAEPEAFIFFEIGADEWRDLGRKQERVLGRFEEVARDAGGRPFRGLLGVEELLRVEPELAKLSELPTRLDFLLDGHGGGLTWVGTFGPCSRWEEGVRQGSAALERFGFPPVFVARPMRGGHFGVLRLIILFNRADEAEVARVREANAAVADALLPLGFVPYKTPGWAVRRYASRIDPGFLELLRRIRRLLDPNGIMNPGRWEV